MKRSLIVVAVLAAGCEQLKAPQKLRELEDRVKKLSSEVATLKGKGGKAGARRAPARRPEPSAAPTEGREAGSGEGSAEGEAGSGAAEGESAGSAEAAAAGEGAGGEKDHDAAPRGHDGEKDGDKDGDKAGDKDHEAAPRGHDEPADKDHEAAHGAGGEKDGEKDAEKDGGKDHAAPRGHDGGKDREPGAGAAVDPSERALQELRDVVAKTTGKRGEPAAKPSKRDRDDAPLTWGYDGKTGPPTWGTLDPAWQTCMTGKAQSPVDIQPRPGTASPITFHYQPTPATLFDDGHTLRVRVESGSSIEIDHRSYQLMQIQFHAPSEHTIAGEHYPLEVQLIHQDLDGKLAGVSVLYDTGAATPDLSALWSRWPKKVGGEDKLKKPFDPSTLLPDTRSVFRYTGSLTTPPCTEGVTWNVMRRTMTDSKSHLEVFTKHYSRNARNLQPLGTRKIE